MRLWSLHPMYLDPQGLVATWREALLARHVLNNQTKGYRNHPQLNRFKAHPDAVALLDAYLWHVCDEATGRGYHFNASKLGERVAGAQLPVTEGQLAYEWQHLRAKLQARESRVVRAHVGHHRAAAPPAVLRRAGRGGAVGEGARDRLMIEGLESRLQPVTGGSASRP